MRSGPALVISFLALAGGVAMASVPPLRGVVEGYYGRPWSPAARRDVIRFLGANGMNAFVYGPKNDDFHRARWREPYPDVALADFHDTARAARTAGVRFIYALSPALDVCYACSADFAALTAKLAQVAGAGVRHFALFFDDAPEQLSHPEDVARYGGSDTVALARAHADLVNRVDRWLHAHDLRLSFMVPTDYAGTECRPYHRELGRLLHVRMPVGWTGDGVFAPTITADQARARRDCVGGHPVVLWDNFPVNDTVLANNLHLGPLTGRDPRLPKALGGHLFNPMTQPYASLVGLGTAGAYLRDPRTYDPEAAWRAAIAAFDSGPGLAVLAEQTRSSPLDHPAYPDAPVLTALVTHLQATYASPDWTPAVDGLAAQAAREASVPDAVAASLGGTALGAEIAPWVGELAAHAARTLDAVRLLRAMKPALADVTLTPAGGGALRLRGRALAPDGSVAGAFGPAFAAPIPGPDLGAYLQCLGNILGVDIGFCPEFGLNVHGKGLAIVPLLITNIAIVTDKNVHQHLVRAVGDAYRDWAARQPAGSVTLALTAGGAPVALEPDGTFDALVPMPTGGRVVLVVRTSAGDATAVTATP